MKVLVAFYSLEGNCRELAGVMAGAVGGDVMEIRPVVQPIPAKGFLRYFKGGKESIMKETPELLPGERNPREYDLVIAGGPVWAWNMAPPLRSFLAGTEWKGLKTALFCMHRGGRGVTLSAMRSIVEAGEGLVAGTADFKDLRWGDADKTRQKAIDWVKSLAVESVSG